MRDRKRKTAFFDLDFSIRKKCYLILRKAIYIFLIEKSRSKNAVFRFRSRIRSGLTVEQKPEAKHRFRVHIDIEK